MEYRQLGRTGLQVSEVGLGCSGFWGDRLFPESKAIAIVCEAFERGVTLFDTGHNYSNYNAEPRLGRAIKQILTNVDRSRLVISSKAGTLRRSIFRQQWSKRRFTDYSPDYIESACSKSINNLNCQYLDIFQLHGIQTGDLTDELLGRLQLKKKRGMYRYLGINTHRETDMLFVAAHPVLFDVILLDFNVCQLDRLPTIEKLNAAGIGVVAGTVLGQGHLINGKIGRLRTSADAWYLARAVLREEGRKLARYAGPMRETLSSIPGMTPAQAAIAFVLEHSPVAACIVGTTQISNLQEVLSASDRRLPAESAAAIWHTFDAQPFAISK
jgi:aryl-alcohol dehydrogenase-like predicted oxidoreductase